MADFTLSAKLVADAQEFEKGFAKAQEAINNCKKNFSAIGQTFQTIGGKIAKTGAIASIALTVPITAGAKSVIDAASDYEENLNKINVVFGDSETAILQWALTARTQFGLSKNQALEMTSLFGDMGTSMGLSTEEAADMSIGLASLAGDLASFKNISVDEAMTALNGIFTGETESLKRLGVVMTEANLEAYAMEQGFGDVYKEMSQGEKVVLRNAYVTDVLSNAIGDYTRTSEGTANSMRTFQSSIDDLKIALGEHLLPIITPIIQKLTEFVQGFENASPQMKSFALAMVGIVAAIGPVLSVIGGAASFVGKLIMGFSAVSGAIMNAGGAMKILGVAFAALTSPVGLVVAAIAAVIAIVVYLWNNCEWFRDSVIAAWEAIKSFFAGLPAFFSGIWDAISQWATTAWANISNVVSAAWQAICTFFAPAVDFFAQIWNAMVSVVQLVWGIIVACVQTNIAILTAVFQLIAIALTAVWNTVCSVASTVWAAICGFVSGAIATIIAVATPIVGVFQSVFSAVWGIVQSVFTVIGSFISSVFQGIEDAWNGLKGFVSGVFDGIFSAVQSLVSAVKGFVNGVIGGINSAIGLINMIPGVSIAAIPYLLHGTDDWSGGFARMNEGGRGELVYLPGGAQVIPHDISVQYAKEAARANASPQSGQTGTGSIGREIASAMRQVLTEQWGGGVLSIAVNLDSREVYRGQQNVAQSMGYNVGGMQCAW